eukprot:9558704-Alexandrium_andersonii.AAC.1
MSASLVGSEMCIRDRDHTSSGTAPTIPRPGPGGEAGVAEVGQAGMQRRLCLLYTSDAADDM